MELDANNIKWKRPEPLKWVDSNGESHLYYSDFYLEDYDVYLDPKNPYCMKLDKEKMSIVTKDVNVIYGDLEIVINYIKELQKWGNLHGVVNRGVCANAWQLSKVNIKANEER